MRTAVHRLAALVAAVALAVAGCGDTDGAAGGDDARLTVVVTTAILGDLVTELVAEDGDVHVLMPPGTDAHGYAPSARDAARLREADLVVANGLGLEERLADPLDAAEADGVAVLHLAELLDPLEVDGTGEHADEEHADEEHADDEPTGDEPTGDEHDGTGDHDDHEHGPLDPHVWTDPARMAEGARILAARLAEADGPAGLDDAEWAARGETLAGRLEALDRELEARFATLPDDRRRLVTNHDSLRYLADRYDLDVVATVIPSTSSQAGPSTRDLVELAALVDELGVPAVFVEAEESTRLAEALAGEVGRDVEIVTLYTGSLGPPGSGAETYEQMLATAAERIVAALSD